MKPIVDFLSRGPWARLIKFGLVGASGVVVNMVVFSIGLAWVFASQAEDDRTVMAGVLAVVVSILTNYVLNDAWTWRDRRGGGVRGWLRRMVKYAVVAGAAGLVQVGVLWLLSVPFGLNEHLANFCGIGAGVVINFAANNAWTFRRKRREAAEVIPAPVVADVAGEELSTSSEPVVP